MSSGGGGDILREWHNIYMRAQRLGQTKHHDKHRKPQPAAKQSTPQEEAEVSLLLDQLSSINFPIAVISKEEILTMVVSICSSLQSSLSCQNGAKFCKLLQTISRSQQLALKQPQIDIILNYLMTLISSAWALSIRLDALRCLSYVVFESGPLCVTKHQALLDLLLPMCAVQDNRGVSTVDKECRRMAINCVGNLCVKCGIKMSKFYAPIFELLYSNFIRHSIEIQKDSSLAKALCSTMRALQFVMQEAKNIHETRISPFFTELKRLSFFGTPLALPPTLASSSSSSSISSITSTSSEGNAKKAARKNKKKTSAAAKGDEDEGEGFSFQLPKPDLPIYIGEHKAYSSSESEFGDDDDRHIFWKVRYHALMCIHVMVRLGPAKLIYQYYPMFVPSSPHPLNYSLFTNIFNDPTAKVRIAALNVLAAIVDSSKSFMLALPLPSASNKMTKSASTSSVHSSYTPVSQTLSGMVREMHNGLFATIDSEQSPLVLLHTIKCVAVLVSVAPYEKMPAGLLSSVLSRMYTTLDNKDTPVRSATLSCLACVFSTRLPHAEVSHALSSILTTTPPSSPIRGAAPATPTFPTHPTPTNPTSVPLSPLLEALLRAASPQDIPNIRAEALHVLGSLSKHYFDILCEAWDRVLQLVVVGLKDTEGIVRYHAAKFLEDFTKSLLELETNGVSTKLDGKAVWERLLQGESAITEFINDTSPQVRASICTTFSHVSTKAAEVLELDQRITMLSLVSSLISDEQPNVRASAARTIGVYILIPVFREDASFVCDAATQLVAAMDDQNLNVRIRTCWSLANLCDSLVSLQDSPVIEDIPVTIIVSVCVCCLKATHENDKIKCNAVRALGNFARFAPHVLLCHSPAISHPPNTSPSTQQTLLCRVARSLVDSLLAPDSSTPNTNNNNTNNNTNANNKPNSNANNAGSSAVKVRWNACYAIGNLLRNKDVFIDDQKSWLPQVFDALTNITKMGKNFKIRINAAMALAVISDRGHYGEHFCNILRAVIEGLENMEEIEDFSEFKYKENLHIQLGNTCTHLVRLASEGDMDNLGDILTTKYSVILATLDFLHSKQPTPSILEIYQKIKGFYAAKNITEATNKFDKRIVQLQEELKDKPT